MRGDAARRPMNAQEKFAAMLRDEVAPALRELGFKGSGQSYKIPSETCWALLGFQKNKWSSAHHVMFTANVTVVSRKDWDEKRAERPYIGERPSPNTYYGTFAWQDRIGMLMPRGEDHWWDVLAETDTREVAASVIEAVRGFVLPAMRDEMQRAEIGQPRRRAGTLGRDIANPS
jgi:Domain of unknown function (DUF4304)